MPAAAVGDAVFGPASVGGYSQHALLDHPVAKPEGLSWEAAASVISVGEAAFRVLRHLDLKAGQTVLILGAGGSVGTIAVQLAAARGISVIGTAAEGDLDRLTGLGATAVRYGDGWADRVLAAAPGGVDAVFDAAGAAAGRRDRAGGRRRPGDHDRRRPRGRPRGALHRRRPGRPGARGAARAGRADGRRVVWTSRSGGPIRSRRPPRRTPILKPVVITAKSSCCRDRNGRMTSHPGSVRNEKILNSFLPNGPWRLSKGRTNSPAPVVSDDRGDRGRSSTRRPRPGCRADWPGSPGGRGPRAGAPAWPAGRRSPAAPPSPGRPRTRAG